MTHRPLCADDRSHKVALLNIETHSTTCNAPCTSNGMLLNTQPFTVSEIGVGDQPYVDRSYIFQKLPPFLHGLNSIQTSNSDESVRSSADDAEWFCFDVEEPVRVYLLYDSAILADHVPGWVAENFHDEHEETGLTDHVYGNHGPGSTDALDAASAAAGRTRAGMGNEYEILSGKFAAGHVCLGGNGCTAEEDQAHDCAMYIPFIGPQEWQEFRAGSAGASARYFDGNSDYVLLPKMDGGGRKPAPKGSFEEITIDVWVRVFDFDAPHPIMNEVRQASLPARRAGCALWPDMHADTSASAGPLGYWRYALPVLAVRELLQQQPSGPPEHPYSRRQRELDASERVGPRPSGVRVAAADKCLVFHLGSIFDKGPLPQALR
jgi:hypothetical protein